MAEIAWFLNIHSSRNRWINGRSGQAECVFMCGNGSLVIAPSLYTKLPYDPVKDFVPLMVMGASPNVFVVPEKSDIKSMVG